MKTKQVMYPELNGGKETEIFYPITDYELDNQLKEIFEMRHYGYETKKDGVYLDVGANIGLATLFFRNWASKIYALEPNPEIYEALVKNVGHFDNVKTFNVAMANADGRNFLYGAKNEELPQTFIDRSQNEHKKAVLANCVSAKTFFDENKIDHVDIMKVDIEEAEYVVFPSKAFAEVADRIDCIIGEGHYSPNGGFPEVIPMILETYGFKTEFPNLPKPNYRRFFKYADPKNGWNKEYIKDDNTIFVARRV